MYMAPLSKLIQGFRHILHHLYADDTHIYNRLTPENAVFRNTAKLSLCTSELDDTEHT